MDLESIQLGLKGLQAYPSAPVTGSPEESMDFKMKLHHLTREVSESNRHRWKNSNYLTWVPTRIRGTEDRISLPPPMESRIWTTKEPMGETEISRITSTKTMPNSKNYTPSCTWQRVQLQTSTSLSRKPEGLPSQTESQK